MAWIEPVTNRSSGSLSRTTHNDFNRICGNINIAFGASLKENWTQNDIVDANTWNTLIRTVQTYDSSITFFSDFDNLNKIEIATKNKKSEEHLYPSEELLPGNNVYPT